MLVAIKLQELLSVINVKMYYARAYPTTLKEVPGIHIHVGTSLVPTLLKFPPAEIGFPWPLFLDDPPAVLMVIGDFELARVLRFGAGTRS